MMHGEVSRCRQLLVYQFLSPFFFFFPPKFIDLLVNKEPLQKAKRKRLNQGRQNKQQQQQQQRQREGTKKHKAENTETQVSTSAD